MNDILYNSSNSTLAWGYRADIEAILPKMIYKVYEQINKMEGKLTAKHYSDIILGIVKQWKQWGAYSSDFLCGLEYALSYNDGFDGSAIVASTRINKIKEIAGDYSTEGKNYHKKYGVYESNNPDSNFNRLIYVCNQILSKDKAQNTDISKVKNQLAKIQQRVSSIDDNNPDGDFITLEDVGKNK